MGIVCFARPNGLSQRSQRLLSDLCDAFSCMLGIAGSTEEAKRKL
jgi:hypothetical protein